MIIAMLATPLVGVVNAGKGQEKLNIEFQVGVIGNDNGDPGTSWMSPKDSLPPAAGGDANVLHIRGAGWDPATTGFMIVVDKGGANEETFLDAQISYSCSFDLNLFFKSMDATIKVRETWVIEGRGYIDILAVEYLYGIGTPDYYGKGIFVGHGEIDGIKINLSGEAGTVLPTGPFRIGTVMGWPT